MLDPVTCFFKCFVAIQGRNASELATLIRSAQSTEAFKRLLIIEFGPHMRWINNEVPFLPILAWLGTISDAYSQEIIVVCDQMNLAFIHKGSYLVRILPSRVVGVPVVVGLGGLGIFHLIDHPSIETLNNLISTIEVGSTIHLSTIPIELTSNNTGHDFSGSETDSQGEQVFIDDIVLPEIMNINQSKTINEFIEDFSAPVNQTLKINNLAYSNNDKISFISSDFRVEERRQVTSLRTIDIDGFFSILSPGQIVECVKMKSRYTICNPADVFDKRTSKAIRKLQSDSGLAVKDIIKAVKFAEIEDKQKFELMICIGYNQQSVDSVKSFCLKTLVKNGHEYANNFPCREDGSCLHSIEHRSLKSGRPTVPQQIKVPGFRWPYSYNSSKCFLGNFISYTVDQTSTLEGLDLFFHLRLIGSKFTCISADPASINDLISELLDPLNVNIFLSEEGPKSFLDISLKNLPTCASSGDKVI